MRGEWFRDESSMYHKISLNSVLDLGNIDWNPVLEFEILKKHGKLLMKYLEKVEIQRQYGS